MKIIYIYQVTRLNTFSTNNTLDENEIDKSCISNQAKTILRRKDMQENIDKEYVRAAIFSPRNSAIHLIIER